VNRTLVALSLAVPVVICAQQPAPVVAHTIRTFYLRYASTQGDQNEMLTALRNIANANLKIFLVPSQNAIVVSGTAEDMTTVQTILDAIDKPHKLYRLTYTFTDTDGGKKVGLERYTTVVAAGQRALMKQGSRVPLVVSSTTGADGPALSRTYLDVGINLDSTVDAYGQGVRLKSKVEESSLAEEKSGLGPEDPVIRQTLLEGVTVLTLGKTGPVGSLDIVGSTRHVEVEALVEEVR
jgi:hypothetical protein